MNKFEFIKYEPTPSEKHMGIATVNLYGKILAKFKVVPTKDGSNFFPAAPSIKIGDSYSSCIILDSNIDKEELDMLIKIRVRQLLNPQSAPAYQSPPQQQMSFLDECPF
jgi:hypothetical protein